jgi:hypothetical protein
MTINAAVSNTEIYYLNCLDSTDDFNNALPKHINVFASGYTLASDLKGLKVEDIRQLIEHYDHSKLTIIDGHIIVSLPEDFEFLEQLSNRSKKVSLAIHDEGDIITEY